MCSRQSNETPISRPSPGRVGATFWNGDLPGRIGCAAPPTQHRTSALPSSLLIDSLMRGSVVRGTCMPRHLPLLAVQRLLVSQPVAFASGGTEHEARKATGTLCSAAQAGARRSRAEQRPDRAIAAGRAGGGVGALIRPTGCGKRNHGLHSMPPALAFGCFLRTRSLL
jgi:hypothetical protein